MNYSLYIAKRLSLSGEGHKSSPAVVVAITAIAISVMVMLFAMAVVSGFKKEISDKVMGFNSDVTLFAEPDEAGDNLFSLTPSLKRVLDDIDCISDYGTQSTIPAIIKTNNDFKGVYLKNPPTQASYDFLRRNLVEGYIPDFGKESEKSKTVISQLAANSLGLKTGDKINTFFLSDEVRVRRLTIAGIYNSHFDNYDDIFIYGSQQLINEVGNIQPNQATALQITTDGKPANLEYYGSVISHRLAEEYASDGLYRTYRVETAKTRGAGYFNWLALLDTNVAVIISLMAAVACITLISGMLIIIADKKRFVGIMKSLGCRNAKIKKIFLFLGCKITIIGLAIGNIIGIALLKLQQLTHFIPLDADSYYIDFVPVEISWWWIVAINIGIIAIIWLTLKLPAIYISRISPAEAIKI